VWRFALIIRDTLPVFLKGYLVWAGESVGGTPTDATETVALPKKSLILVAFHFMLEK
jgi:hypothetical protein